jgi:hypothetical protein
MSLSPRDFTESVGEAIVGTEGIDLQQSVLVYLNSLTGYRPSGYDGHSIIEKDGLLWNDTCNAIFPPCPLNDSAGRTLRTKEELSKELFDQVQEIRDEYIKKQEDSANGKKK